MNERTRFLMASSQDQAAMSELCAEFGSADRLATNGLGVIWLRPRAAEGSQSRADPPGARGGAGGGGSGAARAPAMSGARILLTCDF